MLRSALLLPRASSAGTVPLSRLSTLQPELLRQGWRQGAPAAQKNAAPNFDVAKLTEALDHDNVDMRNKARRRRSESCQLCRSEIGNALVAVPSISTPST